MRNLIEWLAIVQELMAAYEKHQPAEAGGWTVDEIIRAADDGLAILVKHNVTIPELQQLLKQIGPILAFIQFRR